MTGDFRRVPPGAPFTDTAATPPWLAAAVDAAERGLVDPSGVNQVLDRRAPAGTPSRPSAVLVLFAGDASARELPADASVLLTRRASTLRQHSGQIAFPGGATDPGDDGPIETALREANEETGLDPSGVRPLAELPTIFVPPSRFVVTPVLSYWQVPSPVRVMDPAETDSVVAVPVSELLDPRHRFVVQHPLGYTGPAFAVRDMLVWGMTAGILAGMFATFGWDIGWNAGDVRDLRSSLDAVEAELWA